MVVLGFVMSALVFGQVAEPRIDPTESIVIGQARAGLEELKRCERVHGGAALSAMYEGTIAVEGHLMRPGMVRKVPVKMMWVVEGDSLYLQEVSGPEGSKRAETTIAHRGRVAEQPGASFSFKEQEKQAAVNAAADLTAWFPASVAGAARKVGAGCRVGAAIQKDGVTWLPISYIDGAGRVCTALVDGEHRIGRVERLGADQRLGDVCSWVSFSEWQERDGAQVPGRISRFMVVDAATIRYDLSLREYKPVAAGDAFALPAERKTDIPDWGIPPKAAMEFVEVGPRVWAVEIAASDSRVLVIEREKDLMVVGAPDGDAVCGELVRVLKERFSGKPVGMVAIGHHHPSPSGGLRALAAAGATIVAPRGLEEYVRNLVSRPVDLGGPAVAGPRELKAEWFESERVIEGGATVRLIDIGEKSAHAFHYVVSYFPELGVVFEDDLGYFPVTGAARMSPRLEGLVGVLGELHIAPRRLIQAWPVKGVKREVEWSVVAELAKAALEKAK